MTKDEMINSMEYVLKDFEATSTGPYTTKDMVEAILEMQIEVGMLPPTTTLAHFGIKDNAWDES